MSKPMGVTSGQEAVDQNPGLKIFGDADAWKLICKVSSEEGGWSNSTKAMEIKNVGCLIQTETEYRNCALSQSLLFVPGVIIAEVHDEQGKCVGRELWSADNPLAITVSGNQISITGDGECGL